MTVAYDDLDDSPPQKLKPTPLPIYQLFIVYLTQLTEPITASVIYPFVNQFVRDTGVIGGDERKTGYYAGVIVSLFVRLVRIRHSTLFLLGISIFLRRGSHRLSLGCCLRSVRAASYSLAGAIRPHSRHADLWSVQQLLDASRISLYPGNIQWKCWCVTLYCHLRDVMCMRQV